MSSYPEHEMDTAGDDIMMIHITIIIFVVGDEADTTDITIPVRIDYTDTNGAEVIIAHANDFDGEIAVAGVERSDNGDRDSELRAHVIEAHSISNNVTIM